MALWGNKDLVYNEGTIAFDLSTGIGTGAVGVVTWTSAGINTGNVIAIGAGATYGYGVITGFTSTTISIASTGGIVVGLSTIPPTSYSISQEPLYTVVDSVYRAPETKTTGFSTDSLFTAVFGVDEVEMAVANAATGDARKYAPPHTGWVGITTYTDMHGNLRVKHDVLVAGGILTTSDADDDAQFPNT